MCCGKLGNGSKAQKCAFSLQVWRLAGAVVQDFCKNFQTVLVTVKRVNVKVRKRRNAGNGYGYQSGVRGRYRGQTQSQYLNFGSNGSTPGKAEAESTHDGSRAAVSELNFLILKKFSSSNIQ